MDVDKLLIAVASQVPGLIVMAWIVMQFLKHLGKRDERQAHVSEVIVKNTEAFGRVMQTMDETNKLLMKHNGGV